MKPKRCNSDCDCRKDPNPYCHEHREFYVFVPRSDPRNYNQGIVAYCRKCYMRRKTE